VNWNRCVRQQQRVALREYMGGPLQTAEALDPVWCVRSAVDGMLRDSCWWFTWRLLIETQTP
jgi:hypothetical protein